MKGQYGRPAERDRQRERETEDKRGSVSPTPAPRPYPPPHLALGVQDAFGQGAHTAKLGCSLKPSDDTHQHQPRTARSLPTAASLFEAQAQGGLPTPEATAQAKHTQGQTPRPDRAQTGASGRGKLQGKPRQGDWGQAPGPGRQPASHAAQPSGRTWFNPGRAAPYSQRCLSQCPSCPQGLQHCPCSAKGPH